MGWLDPIGPLFGAEFASPVSAIANWARSEQGYGSFFHYEPFFDPLLFWTPTFFIPPLFMPRPMNLFSPEMWETLIDAAFGRGAVAAASNPPPAQAEKPQKPEYLEEKKEEAKEAPKQEQPVPKPGKKGGKKSGTSKVWTQGEAIADAMKLADGQEKEYHIKDGDKEGMIKFRKGGGKLQFFANNQWNDLPTEPAHSDPATSTCLPGLVESVFGKCVQPQLSCPDGRYDDDGKCI